MRPGGFPPLASATRLISSKMYCFLTVSDFSLFKLPRQGFAGRVLVHGHDIWREEE